MLPLSILEKTSTSILYEIPPGTPNPKQESGEGIEKRERAGGGVGIIHLIF